MRTHTDGQVSDAITTALAGEDAIRTVVVWDCDSQEGGWDFLPFSVIALIPHTRKHEIASAGGEIWERDQFGDWWRQGPYLAAISS